MLQGKVAVIDGAVSFGSTVAKAFDTAGARVACELGPHGVRGLRRIRPGPHDDRRDLEHQRRVSMD